jgi:hypothetical protein
MDFLFRALLSFFVLSLAGFRTEAGEEVKLGEFVTYSTLHSIGVEWKLDGDDNHNASGEWRYRSKGEMEWKPGYRLFRIDYGVATKYTSSEANRKNMLAGSLMFLNPGTTYEIELVVNDPDGGGQKKTFEVKTWDVPELPKDGKTHHVVPGAGGGSGTKEDPFKGVAAAEAAAQPGDILLLHAGEYGDLIASKSGEPGRYLVWMAAGDGDAVLDHIRVGASHVWFEGFLLRFKKGTDFHGLRTPDKAECHDVVVKRNRFRGFHYSMMLWGTCSKWIITDNDIEGDRADPHKNPKGGGQYAGEGIELQTASHCVVAYNRITETADAISYPHTNVDIYGNEIFNTTDDAVETDKGHANVRVWGNRIENPFHRVFTFQPQMSGPFYFIRNQAVTGHKDGILLKFNFSDQFLLAHNTFILRGRDMRHSQGLLRARSRNNLWISADGRKGFLWKWDAPPKKGIDAKTVMDYTLVEQDWRTDLDYDGFDPGDGNFAVWKGGKEYADLASFAADTKLQLHGIQVKKEDVFENYPYGSIEKGNEVFLPLKFPYLTLKAGSNAVDAGENVPNISGQFTGKAPDLGAFEVGLPLPEYGPREPTEEEKRMRYWVY